MLVVHTWTNKFLLKGPRTNIAFALRSSSAKPLLKGPGSNIAYWSHEVQEAFFKKPFIISFVAHTCPRKILLKGTGTNIACCSLEVWLRTLFWRDLELTPFVAHTRFKSPHLIFFGTNTACRLHEVHEASPEWSRSLYCMLFTRKLRSHIWSDQEQKSSVTHTNST